MAKPSLDVRTSGVLLHPTSLPGPHGIGDLGPEARRFASFLAESGQRWWQMLPVVPTGRGDSPYNSCSAFAGNPLLISLDGLVKDGLLEKADLAAPPAFPDGRVDFEAVRSFKEPLLRKAFAAFTAGGAPSSWKGFPAFALNHGAWLDDFAQFSALQEIYPGRCWLDWPEEIRRREFKRWDHGILRGLGEKATYHQFLQFLFQRQWSKLRRYCAKRGVSLIGDVPIFVSQDSADVWSHPDLFQLDGRGRPTGVSGVPPDYFSEDGQLWGNPLYRWDVLRARGYDWWLARLRRAAEDFDCVRLDHFIGFCRYWEVPAGAKTARGGRWLAGPGAEFFDKVVSALPGLALIAEDLGSVTEEVVALRDRFRLPGMRIVQFSFGGDPKDLPPAYPRHSVAYTGTHDNDTAVGWFNDPGTGPRKPEDVRREKQNALRFLGADGAQIHWDLARAALESPSNTVILPAQDLLGLGSACRMNLPGTTEGNWKWRLKPGELGEATGSRLKGLTEASGRLTPSKESK